MKKVRISAVVGCVILGLVGCAIVPEAEARSFRSYKAPTPKYKPRPVVKKNTTIINRTTVVQSNQRSGGGLGEAVAGGLAAGVGMGVGSAATTAAIDAVFSDKPELPPVPPFPCPENYVCELVDGNWTVKQGGGQ